jgi:hypothetical protein
MDINYEKYINNMDEYARFLIWADIRLTDIDWCIEKWNEKPYTTGQQDYDIIGKPYNYFYHRYNTTFLQKPANFLYNTKSGIDTEGMLLSHYKKEKEIKKYMESMIVHFRILDVDVGKMHFMQIYLEKNLCEEEWKKFFIIYKKLWPLYWLSITNEIKLAFYNLIIKDNLEYYKKQHF